MDVTLGWIIFLLLLVATVAIAARRMHVPYTVGLVIAGSITAVAHLAIPFQMTRETLFLVFLPPLIFQAALTMKFSDLRRETIPLLTLSTLGVLVAAAVVTLGMATLAHWDWRPSLLFGVLISATDPVAIVALFKDSPHEGRLPLLLEGESLLNDGVAATLFAVAGALVMGGNMSAQGAGVELLRQFGGGVLCGLGVGYIGLLLMGNTEDHLVEATVTTAAAFGSFALALQLGASGVISTLTAGLLLGNLGLQRVVSERGRETVADFWEFAAFIANSMVFLLMGARLARQNYASQWEAGILAILFVLISRAVSVYGTCLLFVRSRVSIPFALQHRLVLGGLRGALALALALGLPLTIPGRDELVTVTFAAVSFSVVVQGFFAHRVLSKELVATPA